MLALFALAAPAQSFITVKPPPRAAEPEVVTPAFVPTGGSAKSKLAPAYAIVTPDGDHGFDVIPVAAQFPGREPFPKKDEDQETTIRTELPGPQKLFIRESEQQFWNRYRIELEKQRLTLFLPEYQTGIREVYRPRTFAPVAKHVEPNYVFHRRLLFEQPNFERAGWDFGILQPALNLGVFYYDAALLPYHCFSDLHNRYECSAGKCLAGDPAPLLLYRERWSTTGFLAQAGVGVGALFLFP